LRAIIFCDDRTLEKRSAEVGGPAAASLAFLHRLTAFEDNRQGTGPWPDRVCVYVWIKLTFCYGHRSSSSH